jgi:large subunit ribosomal protein L17
MRHAKKSARFNKDTAHRRCMWANMLKALIFHEKIVTTVPKAKELRRFAEKLVTLAKDNSLASRRQAIGELMIRYNHLTSKEARAAKGGDTSAYNMDRKIIEKLFTVLGPRFQTREGGYTRIVKLPMNRIGDNAATCCLEYLSN